MSAPVSSTFAVLDPATGEVTGHAPRCTADELDRAFRTARAAQESWRRDVEGGTLACRADAPPATSGGPDDRTEPPPMPSPPTHIEEARTVTDTIHPAVAPADRVEIDDLLARYNWAIDTDDADAFASTFTGDGEFVTAHKTYAGTAELHELMKYLHDKRGRSERSLFHVVANVVLEPLAPGDDGSPRLRFVAQLIGPRISDEGVHTLQLGWYDDVLARTMSGWRFARRHFRPWPDTAPASSPVPFSGPNP